MALRSFIQLYSQVLRECQGPLRKPTLYDAQQAVNDAYRQILQYADWPWLIDRYDIPMVSAYQTGTISATVGSTTVTGSGTAWSTSWYNKKMLLTGDTEEKEVVSFTNPTTAILRYPYNSTLGNVTNVGYQIFQDSYPMPCSPSRDLMVLNPNFQWARLDKFDRFTFNNRTQFNRFETGIRPTIYTDDGVDQTLASPTYGQMKFQFWPTPVTAQDLVLYYFRVYAPLSNDSDQTIIPQEFEEVLIKLAKYQLRHRFGMQGWMEDRTDAMGMLLQMREKVATQSAMDYQPGASLYPYSDAWAIDASLGSWPGRIG